MIQQGMSERASRAGCGVAMADQREQGTWVQQHGPVLARCHRGDGGCDAGKTRERRGGAACEEVGEACGVGGGGEQRVVVAAGDVGERGRSEVLRGVDGKGGIRALEGRTIDDR